MESEPKHKQEVLEWIEDFKAGLIRPPKPYEVRLSKRDVSIFPIGCVVCLTSVDFGLRDDHIHWEVLHEMLHVKDWAEFKESYQIFGIWDYWQHVRKHAPDLIEDQHEHLLTILVGKVFISFDCGSLYLYSYKKSKGSHDKVKHGFTPLNFEDRYGIGTSVECINEWLRDHWPNKKIPKLLRQ